MLKHFKSLAPLIACAAAMPMYGANLVTNGDFESQVVTTPDGFGAVSEKASASLTGWVVSDTDAATVSNVSLFNGGFFGANILNAVNPPTNVALDGEQFVSFNSYDGLGGGSISQELTTAIDQEYTVTFSIASGFAPGAGATQSVIVDADGINSKTQDATANEWTTHSFNFVATGTTTTLSITDNLTGTSVSSDLLVDAVSVTAVPEPGSLALLGLGGLLIARRRR